MCSLSPSAGAFYRYRPGREGDRGAQKTLEGMRFENNGWVLTPWQSPWLKSPQVGKHSFLQSWSSPALWSGPKGDPGRVSSASNFYSMREEWILLSHAVERQKPGDLLSHSMDRFPFRSMICLPQEHKYGGRPRHLPHSDQLPICLCFSNLVLRIPARANVTYPIWFPDPGVLCGPHLNSAPLNLPIVIIHAPEM